MSEEDPITDTDNGSYNTCLYGWHSMLETSSVLLLPHSMLFGTRLHSSGSSYPRSYCNQFLWKNMYAGHFIFTSFIWLSIARFHPVRLVLLLFSHLQLLAPQHEASEDLVSKDPGEARSRGLGVDPDDMALQLSAVFSLSIWKMNTTFTKNFISFTRKTGKCRKVH